MRVTWKAAALVLAPTVSSAYVVPNPGSLVRVSGESGESSPFPALRMGQTT